MAGIGWQQLLIVGIIVLLLFGSSRLPTLMQDLGSSVNSFRKGMNQKDDEDEDDDVKNKIN